jgi:hypothetical protein
MASFSPVTATGIPHHQSPRRAPVRATARARFAATLAAASCLLAINPVPLRLFLALAATGDQVQADQTPPTPPPASQSDFVGEIYRILKTQDDRAIQIGTQLFHPAKGTEAPADLLLNQRITTMAVRANYENAKLTREITEIAVVEYSEGIFVQDQETMKGELKLAQSALESERILRDGLKDQLDKIQRASTGSTRDLAIEFETNDRITEAHRRERKAQLEVAKAEAKLKTFSEFAKPIKMRELQAEVEVARTEELTKRAVLEIELAKEKSLKQAAAGEPENRRGPDRMRPQKTATEGPRERTLEPSPAPKRTRALSVLERAISVDEEVRARLNEIAKDGKLDSTRRNELRRLLDQLSRLMDEADFERSALQLDLIKPRIHRIARGMAGRP